MQLQQRSNTERYSAVVDALRTAMKSQAFSKQEALDFLKMLREQEQEHDLDYVACVLYPEVYPACRVPSRFSVPSALFTHKFSFYFRTNVDGNGYLAFLPQDTTYFCCYGHNNQGGYDGNPSNSFIASALCVPESDSRYIPQNFSSVRLVAASMRISYIGQAQQESGFITGAHVYESEIGRISEEIVENGYFNVRARPYEGIRLVWLPRDNSDQEFFDTNTRLFDATASNYSIDPAGDIMGHNSNLTVQRWDGTGNWVDSSGVERKMIPAEVYGIGAKKLQSTTPTQLVVTWRGLPTNQTWIRVDVDRHFEGTPRTAIRDIVAVAKPKSNEKTLEALKNLSNKTELFGQTIQQAAAQSNVVRGNLADVVDAAFEGQYGRPAMGSGTLGMDGVKQGLPYILPESQAALQTVNAINNTLGPEIGLGFAEAFGRAEMAGTFNNPNQRMSQTNGWDFARDVFSTTVGFENAKRQVTSSDPFQIELGNSIWKRFADPEKTVVSKFNIMGQDVNVAVGAAAMQIGGLVKAFPKVYGKTKSKMYDLQANLFPETGSQLQVAIAGATTQLAKFIKEKGMYHGDQKYGLQLDQNAIQKLMQANSRFYRSMQWYALNKRKVMNAKVIWNVQVSGKTTVIVDYDDQFAPQGSDLPLNDRVVYVDASTPLSQLVVDPKLTSDITKILPELQDGIVTSSDMIKQYLEERKLDVQKQADSIKALGVDKDLVSIKVGFVPFLKRLTILSSEPQCAVSFSVKIYYKQDVFEPFNQFLSQRIVPKQVIGTAKMINGEEWADGDITNTQTEQFRVLKAGMKKISRLNYMISRKEQFSKVFDNYHEIWRYVLKDWADVAKVRNVSSYFQINKYNKGLLRGIQSLYTSSVENFQKFIAESPAVIQAVINADANLTIPCAYAVSMLILAYNRYEQQGASDYVVSQLLKLLMPIFNTVQDSNFAVPRAPRQAGDKRTNYPKNDTDPFKAGPQQADQMERQPISQQMLSSDLSYLMTNEIEFEVYADSNLKDLNHVQGTLNTYAFASAIDPYRRVKNAKGMLESLKKFIGFDKQDCYNFHTHIVRLAKSYYSLQFEQNQNFTDLVELLASKKYEYKYVQYNATSSQHLAESVIFGETYSKVFKENNIFKKDDKVMLMYWHPVYNEDIFNLEQYAADIEDMEIEGDFFIQVPGIMLPSQLLTKSLRKYFEDRELVQIATESEIVEFIKQTLNLCYYYQNFQFGTGSGYTMLDAITQGRISVMQLRGTLRKYLTYWRITSEFYESEDITLKNFTTALSYMIGSATGYLPFTAMDRSQYNMVLQLKTHSPVFVFSLTSLPLLGKEVYFTVYYKSICHLTSQEIFPQNQALRTSAIRASRRLARASQPPRQQPPTDSVQQQLESQMGLPQAQVPAESDNRLPIRQQLQEEEKVPPRVARERSRDRDKLQDELDALNDADGDAKLQEQEDPETGRKIRKSERIRAKNDSKLQSLTKQLETKKR